MATIVKPSTPGWARVIPHYSKVSARYKSPFSLQGQTQLFSGEQWTFDLFLPPLTEAQSADWLDFLHELARDNDSFSLAITNYVPSAVSSPMLVRLIDTTVSWNIDVMKFYGINFSVEEDQ